LVLNRQGLTPLTGTDLVTVVVPTRNEGGNIAPLLAGLRTAMNGTAFEVVVVDDDSADDTAAAVRQEASRQPNVRLIERRGRRGLSSAVMEGVALSTGRIIVMMDADLSHDPGLVPRLILGAESGNDLVVGSRYAQGGGIEGWPLYRRIGSAVLTRVVRALFDLRVRDPLSGFVAVRREVLERQPTRYSARGFKLLLEILATQRSLKVCEVPITFVDRARGKSKLDLREIGGFLLLCGRLLWWRTAGRQAR
jgi:dolichol-phosphate mannosyltransferase